MFSHQQLKYLSLVMLTVQTAAFVIMARRSRMPDEDGNLYRTSTAVFILELTKLILSASVLSLKALYNARHCSTSSQYQSLNTQEDVEERSGDRTELNADQILPEESSLAYRATREVGKVLFNETGLKLLYPATAFAIQNVLQLRAATYLQPAIFQVFNQAKLFTTAVFAYFILRKVLSGVQWISLVVLAIGIVTVQITSKGQAISFQDPADVTLGFILMMIVSFFSGFASVYTELYLKKGNDFWATNAQMAAFSLAPATAMIIFESLHLKSFDIFEYFGGWALSTVLMNALGGIIVSMVIKYADSVLKAFAIAAAILLTIVVNVVFLGAHFRLASLIGIMTVLCSVFLYSAPSLTTRERRQQVHTLEDNTRLEHLKEVDNLEDEETKV